MNPSTGKNPGSRKFPCRMEWKRTDAGQVDASFLLDAPAGKHGFIGVKAHRMVYPDGRRFKIWGINVTGDTAFPSHENAVTVAETLARLGINCIRWHFIDSPNVSTKTVPNIGLFDWSAKDGRTVDALRMDRLDYFFNELKKLGIYSNFNLNVGREYKPGDGVKDCDRFCFAKFVNYFDPRLIELQREFDAQLLCHRNPYTGLEYRHDPALLLVELLNENSLIGAWEWGLLKGKHTAPNPPTWSDIPVSYGDDLNRMFQGWLEENLSAADLMAVKTECGVGPSDPVPRLEGNKGFPPCSKLRFQSELRFYMHLESSYFLSMHEYLKKDLGYGGLVIATSDHSRFASNYPHVASTSKLDLVDSHWYWNMDKNTLPAPGGGMVMPECELVNSPDHSSIVYLARTALEGKPHIISEYNHISPEFPACEAIPILAAYAAFHDWDGVMWYTLEHLEPSEWTPKLRYWMDMAVDPVKMTQLALGAFIFLREDVAPALETVTRSYTEEETLESLRLPRSMRPFFTPGFPGNIALEHATRVSSFDAKGVPKNAPFPVPTSANPILSDTRQLAWYRSPSKEGLVTVNTERTQSLIGFVAAAGVPLPNLATQVTNRFCAMILSSLTREPIRLSSRLVLSTTAVVENSPDPIGAPLANAYLTKGIEPLLVEPVAGTVTLTGLENAREIEVIPLDTAGVPSGPPLSVVRVDHAWRIPLDRGVTVWYLVKVHR